MSPYKSNKIPVFNPPYPAESKFNEFRAKWLYNVINGRQAITSTGSTEYFHNEWNMLSPELKKAATASESRFVVEAAA